MTSNRSAPPFGVVPVLTYPDVAAAVDWLVTAFGAEERVRIDDHRAQLASGKAPSSSPTQPMDAARPQPARRSRTR
jgi:uncharacterized glyoxalase superfamily protein PhnB